MTVGPSFVAELTRENHLLKKSVTAAEMCAKVGDGEGDTRCIMRVSQLFSSLSLPPPDWLTEPTIACPPGMNVNVIDRDLLHALAAVAIERVERH
jgi:hypothetical protein